MQTSLSRLRLARGFTLLELLVVMALIALLATIILVVLTSARSKARFSRTLEEFHQIDTALEFYSLDKGDYPPDVNRGLPPGAEQYLTSGAWPPAPYPNSVYDWDRWEPSDLAYPPFQEVIQISVRFCPAGGTTSQCTFPKESWAANFDADSALYFCIKGPCRAHSSEPVDHPAYCVNCGQ